MSEKYRYALTKEARLIFASIGEKSAPRTVAGAETKYSATMGIAKEDFDEIVKLEVAAIKSECGEFSGKADDYYLACTSGETAAKRTLLKAELDVRGKPADEAFKIKEKAENLAAIFRQFAGILTANSKFGVGLARLESGRVVSIAEDHDKDMTEDMRKKVGNDYFYRGAWVAANVEFKGYRRKKMDDKDGVTAFLQNCMFIRKGERLGGGGPANNEVFGGFAGYSPVDPTALAPDGEAAPAGDDFGSDI